MRMTLTRWFFLTWVLILVLRLDAGAASYLWDPARPGERPGWVASTHAKSGVLLDVFECSVLPPVEDLVGKSLAVVLYYKDGGSGIFRVLWSGPSGQVTLADRLLEGAPMPNRRTLVIQAAEVARGGTLVVQQDVGSGRFLRAKLHWVTPATLLVGDPSTQPALHLDGRLSSFEEIQGVPPHEIGDVFHGLVSAAMLQEAPLSLADEVAFALELPALPRRVLLECEVGSLPPGALLHLWINGSFATIFQADFPNLWDEGWMEAEDEGMEFHYAGWRRACAWVDPSLLGIGDNLIQIHAPGTAIQPVLRRLRIQAAFPDLVTSP